MNAAEIFAPINRYQLEHGLKTTNKQITETTGINKNRLKQIKDHPEVATIGEIERLTDAYKFTITI